MGIAEEVREYIFGFFYLSLLENRLLWDRYCIKMTYTPIM